MGLLDAIRDLFGGARSAETARPTSASTPASPSVRFDAQVETGPRHAEPLHNRTYLTADESAELLRLDATGHPPLRFVDRNGALWLAEVTTGKLVNVGNRYLRRLGIWGVKVRGTTYYDGHARLGPVELVREPNNPYDPNAVAIHVDGVMLGHFNKGMARSLSKLLDGGEPLVAEVISVDPPKVIAARRELIDFLHRSRRDLRIRGQIRS